MTDRENEATSNNSPSAFDIDVRVKLRVEYDLAMSLGILILDSETKNTALLALGHQLRNLSNGRGV